MSRGRAAAGLLLERARVERLAHVLRAGLEPCSRSRVFRAPGAIALTSIPVPSSSSASVSANRTTAAFDAA